MHSARTLAYFFILSISSFSAEGSVYTKEEKSIKACEWLKAQQDSVTGLVRSYDMPGDESAWTYDQAVAIIALITTGEIDTAKHCADGMLEIRDRKHKTWADGYNAHTKQVTAKAVAVGPNAWMGIALLKLYLATNEKKYLSAAEEIGKFMLKLQVKDGKAAGSVPGGYDQFGKLFNWTSTEHNADFIALMAGLCKVTGQEHYGKAVLSAAKWLDREMWDPNLGCYYPGYSSNKTLTVSDFPERLDSQTWTILALKGVEDCNYAGTEIAGLRHNGLPWIDTFVCTVDYQDIQLTGFSKITLGERATSSFWAEGTAGYVLAARTIRHSSKHLDSLAKSLRNLQSSNGDILYSVGISFPEIVEQFNPGDVLIAHFEGHPNCLFGQIGVYGDGEPDWQAILKADYKEPYSWYYEPGKPGYENENVHTGVQSFRLVNATNMCKSTNKGWASLGIDLAPVSKDGSCTKPFDASDCRYLIFWAKSPTKPGPEIKVLFRDSLAKSYLPQVAVLPTPSRLEQNWRKYLVELDSIRSEINLDKLVHIGLALGKDVGNTPGTIIYVDDFAFVGTKDTDRKSAKPPVPVVFPQHWPYGSVAATGWFIFSELNINPFAID